MPKQGYIKLFREIIDKPIWKKSTPEQKSILITLLLMVNHDEREWEWEGQKFKVFPGQAVTSLDRIAEETGKGISIQNVRSALLRFEKLEFLTNLSTKTGRLITVLNWELYQSEYREGNNQDNNEVTDTQQTPNKEVTPNNNDKNVKNDKNVNIYKDVVNYLNFKANTSYRYYTKKTKTFIDTRLSEGFTEVDFKKVIDNKCLDWMGKFDKDGKPLENFLRPQTLFGENFESYLNQKNIKPAQQPPGNYSGQREYDIPNLEKQLLGKGSE